MDMGRCGRTMSTESKSFPANFNHQRPLTSRSLGPMVDSEQGNRLRDEVWKEMVMVFEKEAPDIKHILLAE
jgi:hypothetical protein